MINKETRQNAVVRDDYADSSVTGSRREQSEDEEVSAEAATVILLSHTRWQLTREREEWGWEGRNGYFFFFNSY